MKLIDADALGICFAKREIFKVPEYADGWNAVMTILENAPSVDAVPVVRCRECKMHSSCYTEDVFKFARLNEDRRFCGVGERKDETEAPK